MPPKAGPPQGRAEALPALDALVPLLASYQPAGMVNLSSCDGDLSVVEEWSPDDRKRVELLAVAVNFHLAAAAFETACITTHEHRRLTLRHRARVMARVCAAPFQVKGLRSGITSAESWTRR